MRRRDFIALGAAAAALPKRVIAQGSGPVRRIGVLTGDAREDPEVQRWVSKFREGLRELGWVEGRNLHIQHRAGTGDVALMREYAAELVEHFTKSITPSVL
jgi:putative ABC transport system substrate-binding protein